MTFNEFVHFDFVRPESKAGAVLVEAGDKVGPQRRRGVGLDGGTRYFVTGSGAAPAVVRQDVVRQVDVDVEGPWAVRDRARDGSGESIFVVVHHLFLEVPLSRRPEVEM